MNELNFLFYFVGLLEKNSPSNHHVEHHTRFSFAMPNHPHFQSVFAYVEQSKTPLLYQHTLQKKTLLIFDFYAPRLAVYDETRINVQKAQTQLIILVDGAAGFKSVPI
jgi:hypothetical protein